jgi:MFS family permease
MAGVGSSLLLSRRFGPLFATQFLSAVNGNLVKTIIVFLLTFGSARQSGAALVSIAAALFVTPMILCSAYAGALADARDKAMLARQIKFAEVAVVLLASMALVAGWTFLLLISIFLFGCLSAFLGPIKYAILPQHVGHNDLVAATGWVEAGTFFAILAGQIAGGILTPSSGAVLALVLALLGYGAAYFMPPAPPLAPNASLPRPLTATVDVVLGARRNRSVYCVILAISWFWALGAIVTTQLALIVDRNLGGSPAVATLMLGIFSIGIAVGSMLAGKLQQTGSLVPVAALVMSGALAIFLIILGSVDRAATPMDAALFLGRNGATPMLASLAVLAAAGGVFIVPLYAELQIVGDPARRARDVAANNIMNAVFMVAAMGVAAALSLAGLTAVTILMLTAVANAGVAALLWVRYRHAKSAGILAKGVVCGADAD